MKDFLIHYLSEPTLPRKPEIRQLTDEELSYLRMHFLYFGYSHVDADGRIFLKGGEEEHLGAIFYITQEQLAEFMKDYT